MRQHRCCFTGHREHKLHRAEDEIRKALEEAILLAIRGGFTTFITGMATGVDIWAGEIVLELKSQYPELKLIAAVLTFMSIFILPQLVMILGMLYISFGFHDKLLQPR